MGIAESQGVAGEGRAPVDGRKRRSERTRRAIVEAMHALVVDGDPRPTAAAIASRAKLSVRSVFQHFGDLEEVFLAVADIQVSQVGDLYAPLDYSSPQLEVRLANWALRRQRLHEETAPMRRAALLHERSSKAVREGLELARSVNRHDVVAAFAAELGPVDPADPADPAVVGRDWRLESLTAVGSFRHWEVLRSACGLDSDTAREVLVSSARAILNAV
ncbi:MAG: AcrR family transcriptional regulator [Candidatus Binatia bacterium]|jgi:AcrR family transcriptional regulator